MGKKLIINCDSREFRVGVLEDEALREIYIQRPLSERLVGNVYKGRVSNVLPGMQAAFIDIGLEKNAFLYVSDAIVANHLEEQGTTDDVQINQILKQGQEVVVQVVKEPFGTKGARVSVNINIPGRYIVLMPLSKHIGISRKIEDEQDRSRLKEIAQSLFEKDQLGMILRTVANTVDRRQIEMDYKLLLGIWENIQRTVKIQKTPSLVHRDLEIVPRVIRDVLTEDVEEIVIDTHDEYRAISKILENIAPHLISSVTHYKGDAPIFDHYGIEDSLSKVVKSKVWMKNGGYLIIDHTEALTVIDVNTGKFVGQRNLEDTVVSTNVEAAKEVAAQLRLRNISGIIIVDFIDMHVEENQQKVLQVMEEELQKDSNKTHLLGITRLGLVEITRKKIRKSLHDVLLDTCPTCHGSGKVLSDIAIANRIDREIRHYLRHTKDEAIIVEMHPRIAADFKGANNENQQFIEQQFGKRIFIREKEFVDIEHFNIIYSGDEKEAAALY
ncbi:Rne/Rng family ribonuclease [Desulfuribacillus alkaliarsenatis]|uniref:Ribonuclease G n=1 Tax=Desulfuribacillus alkaliarsenatis TaxID=766136 RepID=A0A1E5G5B2_9FIRM|nr:Rne/Rng family ribonuclease [Desulfuribacillus alkaliarsenatis]OEF98356.1 hypothetical protein BHF68_01360 [Desulfuribacillus alkaliarsenatis]